MGAARLNIPSIVVSGGPMLAGRTMSKGISLTDMFEAVGAVQAGKMEESEICSIENSACPSLWFVFGHVYRKQYELSYRSDRWHSRKRHHSGCLFERLRLAKLTGMKIMELVEKDIKPRDIITPKSLHNALSVDMAPGLQHQQHASSARHSL